MRTAPVLVSLFLAACAAAPAPIAPEAERHELPVAVASAPGLRFDVQLDSRARTILLELGPVDLPAGPHAMLRTPLLAAELPVDGWITTFDVELVDADGTVLPQAMLHHVNVMLPDRGELFRPIMQRLVAAGEETEAIRIPWPFGVPIRAQERLAAYAMLHDPAGAGHRGVTIRMRMRYATGARYGVQPFFMDASPPPGSASWDLPPGRSERVWEGSPAVDGRFIAVGGHAHRYATELAFEDAVSGRVLFRLRPVHDENGELSHVERRTFVRQFGLPVRANRRYRIVARYDNPTGETIPDGAMGAIGGVILPSGRWPAADALNPLFVEDLRQLTIQDQAHAHHH